jgi:hypothetical protein
MQALHRLNVCLAGFTPAKADAEARPPIREGTIHSGLSRYIPTYRQCLTSTLSNNSSQRLFASKRLGDNGHLSIDEYCQIKVVVGAGVAGIIANWP